MALHVEVLLVLAAVNAAGCAAEREDRQAVEQTIIGGETTEPGEYPATGALVRGKSGRCTATLIAPDVAITAAHCMTDEGYGDFGFTLDPDLLANGPEGIVPVLLYHEHPEFDGFSPDGDYSELGRRNDIAVVILAEPIEGVTVERLDWPSRGGELRDGTELALCGYGRDSWSVASTAGRKRHGVVFVDHASSWELQTIDEDPQPCKGDSGGPVFAQTDEGRVIVGLVSRAHGLSRMCDTGAIYTRVAPYAEWIEEAAADRELGCSAAGDTQPCPFASLFVGLLVWLRASFRRKRRLGPRAV